MTTTKATEKKIQSLQAEVTRLRKQGHGWDSPTLLKAHAALEALCQPMPE